MPPSSSHSSALEEESAPRPLHSPPTDWEDDTDESPGPASDNLIHLWPEQDRRHRDEAALRRSRSPLASCTGPRLGERACLREKSWSRRSVEHLRTPPPRRSSGER